MEKFRGRAGRLTDGCPLRSSEERRTHMRPQTIITVPTIIFDGIALRLSSRYQSEVAICAAGTCEREGRVELLHHSVEYARIWEKLDVCLKRISGSGMRPMIIAYASRQPSQNEMDRYVSAFRMAGVSSGAFLQIRRAQGILAVGGWLLKDDEFSPVDILNLPGPGMTKLAVGRLWPLDTRAKKEDLVRKDDADAGPALQGMPDLSRLKAFVGEGDTARGEEILNTAGELRIALVGCGRMGCKMVIELVKSGVARIGGYYFIDGDVVEEANRDVMMLPKSSVGKPKAEELAKLALALDPGAFVVPIVATVSDRLAAEAVVLSDVIFTCPDNDAPVFGTEVLSRRHNRIHFATSGGTAHTRSRAFAAGGEVYLSMCGCAGCPVCFAGMDHQRAIRELSRSREEERKRRANNDWLAERPGSSGAVLSSVAGTVMHLFWRLLQGKQRRSVWLHYDANGEVPNWH
jgi:hypothetical protein